MLSFSVRLAPVAQWIEHRPPEPGAQVRILSGVLLRTIQRTSPRSVTSSTAWDGHLHINLRRIRNKPSAGPLALASLGRLGQMKHCQAH